MAHLSGAELAWYSLNVATDGDDNVLAAGGATGPNGDRDALVAKLTPTGDPLWTTFIGGAREEDCLGLAIDADGNALVTGRTWSAAWVSDDAFDPDLGGESDAFVAQISPAGELVWSSYLGGSNHEDINGGGIAYDPAGYAVVVGDTGSQNLSTDGSQLNGFKDGFVAKIALGDPNNARPVAVGDSYLDAVEDTLYAVATPGVLANDTDAENEPLTALLVQPAAHGAVVLLPDGGFTYMPELDFHGADRFAYRAFDGSGYSDPATVMIEVSSVDDGAPLADAGGPYEVYEEQTIVLDASGTTDPDLPYETLTYAWDFDGDEILRRCHGSHNGI